MLFMATAGKIFAWKLFVTPQTWSINIIEIPLQQHEERGVKIAPNLWCKVNLVEVSVFSTLLLEKLSTLTETDLKENHKGEGS